MASETESLVSPAKRDIAEILIAGFVGLTLAITALFLCVVPLVGSIAGGRDFVIYWATGQQLVHHANPYDTAAMTQIEQSAGLSPKLRVGFMRNPPWALPLALPLGLVGVRIGALLWSLLLLGCLALSVRLLWKMLPGCKDYLPWLKVCFAPAILCVMMGQTSLFALLGYVLFLRLHLKRPLLAGMSLWLCTLKPHLFVIFGVVLMLWIVINRSYKIVAGAAIALAASCAIAACVDPTAWIDYAQMMRTYGIEKEFIPCFSIVLRLWLSPQSTWLQYLPCFLGCIWAVGYFWPRRHTWDWMKNGSPLMLVSIITAPYCWLFDQALAIPALMYGAYVSRSKILLVLLAFSSLPIQIALGSGVKVQSALFLWAAPAWLVWYLFATRTTEWREEKTFTSEVISN